jgi:hypothetical protein
MESVDVKEPSCKCCYGAGIQTLLSGERIICKACIGAGKIATPVKDTSSDALLKALQEQSKASQIPSQPYPYPYYSRTWPPNSGMRGIGGVTNYEAIN